MAYGEFGGINLHWSDYENANFNPYDSEDGYFIQLNGSLDAEDTTYTWTHYLPQYLRNSDFENLKPDSGESDYRLPTNWEFFPNSDAVGIMFDGESIHESDSVFNPFDGSKSLRLWSNNDENSVFQTFYPFEQQSPGYQFVAQAQFFQSSDDLMGPNDSLVLFVKHYSDEYNLISTDISEPLTASGPTNDWIQIELIGYRHEEAAFMQIGAMFVGSQGSVYIDNFTIHGAHWANEYDVSEELFINDAIRYASMVDSIDQIHYEWNVSAWDGENSVLSDNGPFYFSVTPELDWYYECIEPQELQLNPVDDITMYEDQYDWGALNVNFDHDYDNNFGLDYDEEIIISNSDLDFEPAGYEILIPENWSGQSEITLIVTYSQDGGSNQYSEQCGF